MLGKEIFTNQLQEAQHLVDKKAEMLLKSSHKSKTIKL